MMKKLLAASLAAILMVTTIPGSANAGDTNQPAGGAATIDLRSAIDRSAARLAADAAHATLLPKAYRESATETAQGGGGGGSTGMMVMMIVGLAASVGGGYLIYKEMKKQTNQAAQANK